MYTCGVAEMTQSRAEPGGRLAPQRWATRLSDLWDVGLLVLGSDGGVDFANARARALLDASTDEQLDERWIDLKGQLAPALRDVHAATASLEINASVTTSAGSTLRVQVYLVEEDECIGYLLLLQHADRAAAVDRSLRHAARNRCLTSLSRDTAHSLKDVLNVIAMNVELLSRAADGGAADATQAKHSRRYAEIVRRELRRIDRSLDGLLGRHTVEHDSPQTFDLKAVCEALLQLISARAFRQHVEVVSALGDGPAEMSGFADRLHAALLSLMVNALDAMPDGGTLRVVLTKGPAIQIQVHDSGAGIEPDRLSDVWKLYFTTKARGTGIGLYVTRSIVEAHGGTVHYQQKPEGGSCFTVVLPTAKLN